MTCTLQFVDSIASNPGVRLDLTTADTWLIDRERTDFPPPPLKQALPSTLLTDGGPVPASAFDRRVITLGLHLNTSTADSTATQVQNLIRELNRPSNILKWHEHTTNPVFFRTFRAAPNSIRREGFATGKRKQLQIELLAEPFAYGLLETPVSGVSVSTDPAQSNGNFVDIAAANVKGDVETPALIRWPTSAIVANRKTLFAVRRRGTPSNAPYLFQAEALTQGVDTTTQPNDATFSGTGNNYSRCTFATATFQTRLTLSDLGTASVDLRGRYHVYALYRKNTSTDDIHLRIKWGLSGGIVTTNDSFTTIVSSLKRMADLGEIQIPRGWDPVTNFRDGVEVAVSDTFLLAFQADRTGGGGTLDIDYLLLVPADDRFAIAKWVEDSPDRWWLDADDNSVHARDSSDLIATAAPPGLSGGLPMLTPNQANRIYMLLEVGTATTPPLTTTAVTVSYFPRYLSVRPAST